MFMFHLQTARQKHKLLIANECFENVEKIKYLGVTAVYQHCTHEQVKNRLTSVNACYRSV
jgi:hypothetical protein